MWLGVAFSNVLVLLEHLVKFYAYLFQSEKAKKFYYWAAVVPYASGVEFVLHAEGGVPPDKTQLRAHSNSAFYLSGEIRVLSELSRPLVGVDPLPELSFVGWNSAFVSVYYSKEFAYWYYLHSALE